MVGLALLLGDIRFHLVDLSKYVFAGTISLKILPITITSFGSWVTNWFTFRNVQPDPGISGSMSLRLIIGKHAQKGV
jgi:hypothetical protein